MPPGDTTAADFHLRAIGQEPGWLLEIDPPNEIRFSYDYGQRTLTTPVPPPADSAGTKVWNAKAGSYDLRIVVADTPCEDVMSGKPYPATVTVTLNGKEFRGCGERLATGGSGGTVNPKRA
jgi:putative lipoprotein